MSRSWKRTLLTTLAGAVAISGAVTATTSAAVAAPGDNLAWTATASASYTSPWESIGAVRDGIDPPRSNDTQNPRWGTWPNQGQQWVDLTWPATQTIRAAEVYFFDDGGGVRVPASWRLQSWNGSAYVDVTGASGYPVAVDRYNLVTFAAVTTTRLRVLLESGGASVGLLEVKAHTTAPGDPGTPADWNPPANLVTPLNEVWAHQEATYGDLYGFRNYGWDQVFANGGYLNFCVRWDSPATVTAALRDQIHAKLAQQYKKWMDVMAGHNNWPYASVPIKVVGWAVRDRAQLQWSDTSVDIYVNNIRENAPQCAEGCGRFFNRNGSYPNCPGGTPRHYDQSLWLTTGFGGGAGGDWGQRMASEYFVNNLDNDSMTILLHEIGHTFGLDDFYDWTPTGVGGFIMKAGSSATITDFDRWMLRDWWRHLKSRYGR